jgi:hypothetical protein
MLWPALRIAAGFAAASLAAGAAQTLFVIDPGQIFASAEGAAAVGLLITMAATQTATFALPFALIALVLSEVFALKGWLTYVSWGVLIALSGFATVMAGDGEVLSFGNAYALWAFLISGAVAGWVYWAVAGRAGLSSA